MFSYLTVVQVTTNNSHGVDSIVCPALQQTNSVVEEEENETKKIKNVPHGHLL